MSSLCEDGVGISQTTARCEHCGTEFKVSEERNLFCCSGCEYVYRLIHDEKLDRFYDLKGGKSSPVGDRVFARENFDWLSDLVGLNEKEGIVSLKTGLSGISCVGCVWLIEKLFNSEPGGLECRIDAQKAEVRLRFQSSQFDVISFARRLEKFGYSLRRYEGVATNEISHIVWRLAITSAFALNAMLYTLPTYFGMKDDFSLSSSFSWMSALFASLSMIFGGSYFIVKAARAALVKAVHIDLPISLGLVFAYVFSWYGFYSSKPELVYFDFVSVFVFLMLLGRWLQERTIEANRNRLTSAEMSMPLVDRSAADGSPERVPSSDLRKGDVYWVRSSQFIPVRSELRDSDASLSLSWITGESEPSLFRKNSIIPSGAKILNTDRLQLKALENWSSSLLHRLLAIDEKRLFRDDYLQRFIVIYLVAVICIAIGSGVFWFSKGDLDLAFQSMVSVLVVSCPCAIGIALPLVDDLAQARLRACGLYPRIGDIWAKLRSIKRIIFDKTGTLTRTRLSLVNTSVFDSLSETHLEALSSLARESAHPVAATIRERLMVRGSFSPSSAYAVKEEIGLGLEGNFRGNHYRLGKGSWAAHSGGGVDTVFSCDGKILAKLHFEDRPRPDAQTVFKTLDRLKKRLSILSGDQQSKVDEIANGMGVSLEASLGNLSPFEKANWIRRNQPSSCLMIGDGMNDSVAFEVAGCSGTPVTESELMANKADFYYSGDGLEGVVHLFAVEASRRLAYRAIILFAISYNLFAVGLAIGGFITPLLASVLMPISSLVSLSLGWIFLRKGRV